jgi:ribosomal protein L11 methyltransferase
MEDHVQVTFTAIQPEQQEWVIAHLAEAGYDGFEEDALELKAFIPFSRFDNKYLHDLSFKYQLHYSHKLIPSQNWNEIWESSFHPVRVGEFVMVRASFHEPAQGVKHEIIITPKMSFGTGHHATTWLMLDAMQQINFTGKEILDYGTGTGLLAILSEKLGATNITAIDIDEWSIMNAAENIALNKCAAIQLLHADNPGEGSYDIILANINRNILLDKMEQLARQLKKEGVLLLSGILPADLRDILQKAADAGLKDLLVSERDGWLCVKFGC